MIFGAFSDIPRVFWRCSEITVPDVFGGVPDVSRCFPADSRDVRIMFPIILNNFRDFMIKITLITLAKEQSASKSGTEKPLLGFLVFGQEVTLLRHLRFPVRNS